MILTEYAFWALKTMYSVEQIKAPTSLLGWQTLWIDTIQKKKLAQLI
jgi:hypothetical protein